MSLELVLEVEDLCELGETGVGACLAEGDEELRHLRLPPGVDVRRLHPGEGGLQVGGLEVADQQAVLTQEQRVVVPPGRRQCAEHVGPDRPVPCGVLLDPVGPDLELEAHALRRHRHCRRSVDQKWNWSMLLALNLNGSPSRTTPSAPTV